MPGFWVFAGFCLFLFLFVCLFVCLELLCGFTAHLTAVSLLQNWTCLRFTQIGCLTLLSIAVMNTVTKSNLGRKRFIGLTLPHDSLSPREIKAKSSRQEPEGRY